LAYKVKLETFSFTPTIAVKASEQLSVAMGLEAMTIDFTQKSMASASPLIDYEIHGTGISWGGNFSFTYRPEWAEKWALGAMYRSKVKQNLDGYIHTSTGTNLSPALRHAPAAGAINLPDSLSFGLAFQPTEKWVLEAGVVGTFWSAYDQIVIEYTDTETAPTIHNKKLYQDTYRLNFGAEYMLTQKWALRAGYVYDKSPINSSSMDTLVPVDDRHLVSAGFGYAGETWSVDMAYTHLFGKDLTGDSNTQSGNIPMKYSDGRSDMLALTFGYKF
jgi:long-chain fatty acid transport protein